MKTKQLLLTAFVAMSLANASLAQTVPNYLPTNGLVGWWPFNGNAIDESINTNDGTVNGATLTADRFGNANKAYSFDGVDDFIQIPNTNLMNGQNGISVSAWCQIIGYNGQICPDCYQYIVSKGSDASTGHFGIKFSQNPNSFDFFTAMNNFQTNGYVYSNGSYPIPQSSWHNLILFYDNQNVKVYVDGIFKNSIPYTLSYIPNSDPILVGKHLLSSFPYFTNGKIDDIGIWNRALTQQEITGLYNANLCFQTITVTDTLLINTNITGFNPVTYQNTIKIWPNPTHDHITIDNGNLANLTGHQVKISNALGQVVFQSAITQQQFYVDMSTWGGNGIYFVNLINAQGVTIETRKIVLQ